MSAETPDEVERIRAALREPYEERGDGGVSRKAVADALEALDGLQASNTELRAHWDQARLELMSASAQLTELRRERDEAQEGWAFWCERGTRYEKALREIAAARARVGAEEYEGQSRFTHVVDLLDTIDEALSDSTTGDQG